MKYLLLSCGLLAGMLFFCVGNAIHLNKTMDETASLLEQAGAEVGYDNYNAAALLVEQAARQWQSHSLYYGTVLRHDETDEIIGGFAALRAYALCGDVDEFSSLCAQLIRQLEHIAGMEQPLAENVL